ncbi:hypothetical protein ASG43_21645 [Aureimonas sp. Leaf454]|uniref:PepSY domain-containing protein n=1 Tax=Aureimonas sp. Leaf454 TaxID=1736381 RepID=UPI0007021EF3|nr:PepSY domain-containing protein [Aureimonas sp. Leaf454]KQT50283.1 hypothetical protein ASG43_21645 [Aureimonas sp. Leaf454]
MRGILASGFLMLSVVGSIAAEPTMPAPNGVKASEIVAAIEKREGYAYLGSIELKDDNYRVVYYMSDGAEVTITYSSATGQPVAPEAK